MQINDIKTQVNNIKTQINNVKESLHNYTAILLNSLWKWSNDPIEPVLAPIQIKNY